MHTFHFGIRYKCIIVVKVLANAVALVANVLMIAVDLVGNAGVSAALVVRKCLTVLFHLVLSFNLFLCFAHLLFVGLWDFLILRHRARILCKLIL
jgi:hypothetical protein